MVETEQAGKYEGSVQQAFDEWIRTPKGEQAIKQAKPLPIDAILTVRWSFNAGFSAKQQQLDEAMALLRKIRNAGQWFHSALEIDELKDNPTNGKELEAEIDAILARHQQGESKR